MSGGLKRLSGIEIEVYSNAVHPIRGLGCLKFWVETKDASDDIRDGKIVGLAIVKKFKRVKIKVPAVGYKGRYRMSPQDVLPQLDRRDFPKIGGYSVKVHKGHKKNFRTKENPNYYDATVTLYLCESKPPKLLLKRTDLLETIKKNVELNKAQAKKTETSKTETNKAQTDQAQEKEKILD